MAAAIRVEQVNRGTWTSVSGLAARAFFDEEFVVGMYGAEPLQRWADVHHLYRTEEFDPSAVHLVAYVGDAIGGVLRVSPFGSCFVCRRIDPATPPADERMVPEWRFEVEVQRSHQGVGEHAWISRVAVEPQLHGAGLGTALLEGALDHLALTGSGPVLLECLAYRESFYLRSGFHRVATLVDPFADTSYLMRLDLPR